MEAFNGDTRTMETPEATLSTDLYPGRNYTVLVYAVSNAVESEPETRNILTS